MLKKNFLVIPSVIYATEAAYVIPTDDALSAVTSQTHYFKSVDDFKTDVEDAISQTHNFKSVDDFKPDVADAISQIMNTDTFGKVLQETMSKVNVKYTPSSTIVMEAAFYLLTEGVRNSPLFS